MVFSWFMAIMSSYFLFIFWFMVIFSMFTANINGSLTGRKINTKRALFQFNLSYKQRPLFVVPMMWWMSLIIFAAQPMRWCGCVSGQMRWARLALGKRGKPTLPNPKLGRCWPLTWGIQSLPLLILHLVLASYEQLLTALPLTHPHNCPISRYLAPGEFFDEQRLADDRWRPLSTPPRSSINLVICSLPLQCMDLCTISVRTFLFPYFWIYAWSVWEFAGWWERERADPTVPPPQPIWRDRPIHGIRHTQAESTKIPSDGRKKHINVTAGLHWKRPSATKLEIVLEGL